MFPGYIKYLINRAELQYQKYPVDKSVKKSILFFLIMNNPFKKEDTIFNVLTKREKTMSIHTV